MAYKVKKGKPFLSRNVKPNEPDAKNRGWLKLATVHRVKGLEFDQVILASANEVLIPLDYTLKNKGDAISLDEAETEERSLVYVALIRARKSAVILSYGKISHFFNMNKHPLY